MDIATQIKELADVKQELRKFANALNLEIAKKSDGFKDLLLELQEAGATQGAVLILSDDGSYYKFTKAMNSWEVTENYKIIIPSNKNKIPVKTIEAYSFGTQTRSFSFSRVYIPETIETIKSYAFANSRIGSNEVDTIVLPKSIKEIQSNAFSTRSGSKFATNLYIMSKAGDIQISSNAFYSNAFERIYVPWSEGEVSGTPWGATQAEIIYNTKYTGGEY